MSTQDQDRPELHGFVAIELAQLGLVCCLCIGIALGLYFGTLIVRDLADAIEESYSCTPRLDLPL